MKNIDLIFSKNPKRMIVKSRNFNSYYKAFVFKVSTEIFDGVVISKLVQFIQGIKEKNNMGKLPIRFIFSGSFTFADKLTYIIFECICFSLINDGHKVSIAMSPEPSILTEGVMSSPLLNLALKDKSGFKSRFSRIIEEQHYRRLVPINSKIEILSVLTSDIASFLKRNGVNQNSAYQFGELAAELVGNSHEHSQSDCIVDIDVSSVHSHKEDVGKFIGINLVVINFSSNNFGVLLKKNIQNEFIKPDNLKYKELKEIYLKHENYFDKVYTRDVFFSIASLQPKISGQYTKSVNGVGGVGTLKLIDALREKSYLDDCYLYTGNRVIRYKDNLYFVEKGWIGFNKQKDFKLPPDMSIIGGSAFNLSGTAYNLNFIIKI